MFKKVTSFLLIICLLLAVVPTEAFATENYVLFEDENGELLKLYITEEKEIRISEVYNSKNELMASFTYYKTENEIKDNITGIISEAPSIAASIEMEKDSIFCDAIGQNTTNSEPNFCNKGQSYTSTSYTTVGSLLAIGSAITLTAAIVIAKIGAYIGTQMFLGAVSSGFVGALISAAASGQLSKRVTMTTRYTCTRFWHSDPFDPAGGFYFYGYKVSSVSGTV